MKKIILKKDSKLNKLLEDKEELEDKIKKEKDKLKNKELRFKLAELEIRIEVLKSKP